MAEGLKPSLMVTFFTAFICCCYGYWSTAMLSTCLPTQIQLEMQSLLPRMRDKVSDFDIHSLC